MSLLYGEGGGGGGGGGGDTGFIMCVVRPSARPSVDEIVSVLYFPQY